MLYGPATRLEVAATRLATQAKASRGKLQFNHTPPSSSEHPKQRQSLEAAHQSPFTLHS